MKYYNKNEKCQFDPTIIYEIYINFVSKLRKKKNEEQDQGK